MIGLSVQFICLCPPNRLIGNWLRIVLNNSIPTWVAIGVYGKCSPSYAMNDSETRRSPHKGTESHRKNKYLFQILPTLLCCSEWIHRQEGNREKASRKPQWKNYDFTMFLSRITASHGIAVDWYLRVYWLLPFSIVDSFAEHRRFFCRAPWILGLKIGSVENQWG